MSDGDTDVVVVDFGPREIVLRFGAKPVPSTGGDEQSVALSSQVVLDPKVAPRLIASLHESLKEFDRWTLANSKKPKHSIESLLDQTSSMNNPANLRSSAATPSESARRAALLFRLVQALGAPYAHERSFRLREGEVLSNRFLLTLDRSDLGEDANVKILGVCEQMGMHAPVMAAVVREISAARSVHFGFEGDGEDAVYKVYLEFPSDGPESIELEGGNTRLLHRSFKWNATAPQEHVETHYVLHPALDVAGVRAKIGEIYAAPEHRESCEIASEIVALAAARMSADSLQYLEVGEGDNARTSFDINLYDSGLEMRDLHPFLSRMRRHFKIPPGRFQALYDQIKVHAVGHLAGGVHRNGKEFFNLYYGVESR
jgi:tryptophan halogenase